MTFLIFISVKNENGVTIYLIERNRSQLSKITDIWTIVLNFNIYIYVHIFIHKYIFMLFYNGK